MYRKTLLIKILQNEAIIEFKFDVQVCCRVQKALSLHLRQFSIPLSGFREKLIMKTSTIENV